ncbi:glycosyltransferase [Halobacteriovorax sp. HLS]|uniref:glycosyltransferase n=1 Tax=Halobacteriovorax sp. HLS TaxID=2234000 RepID=UPI000FD98DE9|nr:glycosyltransferase [Halobacteriovorax sp. HLS]
MKIVFQHNGILPVQKYGGIERILFWHMKELARRGHEVILFGHPDSQVQEFGIQLVASPTDADEFSKLIPTDADIVHLTYNYVAKSKVPTIVNMQCNGQIGEEFPVNSVFVSKRHAQNHGSGCFVYNALDFDEYPYEESNSSELNNFLFLAKGSWGVKNLKHCIQVCKKAKKHLHIAGGRALLPSRYIHSYGMVGGDEKISIMKKCDAFLFPVRWHEPFGIAIIEAMAMGMPVFGGPYGSLPEIINEVSGKICNSKEELLAAVKCENNQFERDRIRQYVVDKFSISTLTDEYLKLYERVISGESLNSKKPTWQLSSRPEELLPF